MRRLSHDLGGVTGRIAKLSNEYEAHVSEAAEVWRDAKGQSYFHQHTSEVAPTIAQLVATLAQANELFEEISKRVRDPDAH